MQPFTDAAFRRLIRFGHAAKRTRLAGLEIGAAPNRARAAMAEAPIRTRPTMAEASAAVRVLGRYQRRPRPAYWLGKRRRRLVV
jgi:hypothetical protein